jgi:hypothetical protein
MSEAGGLAYRAALCTPQTAETHSLSGKGQPQGDAQLKADVVFVAEDKPRDDVRDCVGKREKSRLSAGAGYPPSQRSDGGEYRIAKRCAA